MVFLITPEDHFKKLRRIADRLEKDGMHPDDMDDFCKTAWHLVELVEKKSDREMRKKATALRTDPDIALCEHAANTSKHGDSKRGVKEKAGSPTVEIEQGYGVGRYGKGGYGIGERSITFKFKDGTERNAFEFVATVLQKWENVFTSPA